MCKRQNIEFLRIVFTYIIVFYHILTVNFNIWTAGWLGVEFFFILSGVFFTLTYDPKKDIHVFIEKKIIRFLPVTIFGAIIALICNGSFDANRFFADVFLYSGIFPNIVGYNGPAWYISVLFWVLLIFFMIRKSMEKNKAYLIIFVITFVSSIWVIKYRDIFMGVFSSHLVRGLSCIGIGCFVGETCMIYQEKVKNNIFISILELFCLLYSIFCIFVNSLFCDRIIACICFSFLIFLFLQKKGFFSRILDNVNWSNFSKYCLSIFLTHGAVTSYILPKYLELGTLKLSVIAVIAITLLGVVTYYTVEYQIEKFLRRKLNENNNYNYNH